MNSNIIDKALACWGLEEADVELITQRENHIYKITTLKGVYALRLHRLGLRNIAEINSELPWMSMLRENGIIVPAPLKSKTGKFYHTIDDIDIDILDWLNGMPMGMNGELGKFRNLAEVYHTLGKTVANVHNLSDKWEEPKGFTRPAWDRDGIVGEEPIWGKFWENHCLYFTDKSVLTSVKNYAYDLLGDPSNKFDYGLIHADLIPDNVIIHNNITQLANFGDCGYGYRLFDIATILNSAIHHPNYLTYKAAFIEGYCNERSLDETYLLLFQTLRAFTYLGWIIPRLNEPGGSDRCKKFIQEACYLAAQFLGRA